MTTPLGFVCAVLRGFASGRVLSSHCSSQVLWIKSLPSFWTAGGGALWHDHSRRLLILSLARSRHASMLRALLGRWEGGLLQFCHGEQLEHTKRADHHVIFRLQVYQTIMLFSRTSTVAQTGVLASLGTIGCWGRLCAVCVVFLDTSRHLQEPQQVQVLRMLAVWVLLYCLGLGCFGFGFS